MEMEAGQADADPAFFQLSFQSADQPIFKLALDFCACFAGITPPSNEPD
jgi:hypothetical protein